MSHLFISYCHDDEEHLREFLSWLNKLEVESSNIWYDKDIRVGNKWRNEITDAIKESSLVIVILTQNSAKRPYVIFEWAYALGHGINVIPLKFDDVQRDDIPDPLLELQYVDWHKFVPDELSKIIKQVSVKTIEESKLASKIDDIAHHTYQRFSTLDWFAKYRIDSRKSFFAELLDIALMNAAEEHQELEELLLSYYSSMPSKLKLQLRELIAAYATLATISNKKDLKYLDTDHFVTYNDLYLAKFRDDWLPVYSQYFQITDTLETINKISLDSPILMVGMLKVLFPEKLNDMHITAILKLIP